MKKGVSAAAGSWVVYLVSVFNVFQIEIPSEYNWIKQIISAIPLALGHSYLIHRYHTRD